MLEFEPLVSVIMPVFNHQFYVEQAILSVFNQTYKNIELIVIDDGSTDNSALIVNRLKEQYNFKFIQQENIGLCETLNRGIFEFAKGDFIALLASDDYWDARKTSRQVQFLSDNPDVQMCCSNAQMFGLKNGKVGVFNGTRISFHDLIYGNKIAALTVLIRRSVFDSIGKFDPSLYFEDWDMWLRISRIYNIAYMNEPLAFYRTHEENMSNKTYKMATSVMTILNKWKNEDEYCAAAKHASLLWFNELCGKDKIGALSFFRFMYPFFLSKLFIRGCCKLIFLWR